MDIKTEEINYTDSSGLKQGLWIIQYGDHNIKWEENYINGRLHGLYRRWHYGQLACDGSFMNGLKNGLWGYWNSHSELMWKGYYVNGIQDGEQIKYGY